MLEINIALAYDHCGTSETLPENLLKQIPCYKVNKLCSFKELYDHLQNDKPDVILLDLSQSKINRLAALISLEYEAHEVPIIVITENEDEDFALQLVRQGAQDHLGLNYISLPVLKKSIRLAIERKVLQSRLEFYMNNFEASNKNLETFAYIASHDLQEPLRKIISFGDRLEKKCSEQLNDQGKTYVGKMQSAASRMKLFLNDLLEYSRAGRDEPKETIDLNQIISQVKEELAEVIECKSAEIISENLPMIEANPCQIQQLIQNLISNAIKYSKPDTPPIVQIKYHQDDHDHFIEISDNGIGFKSEYAKKIFDQFFRLHGKSSNYEGTGIGLAICKKIINQLGGDIEASSEEGVGSKFSIKLPNKELSIK